MTVNDRYIKLLLFLTVILQACGAGPPPKELLTLTDAQMKIRSFQTRAFDVNDQNKVLRGVVASLQDLGFIVERSNGPMGLVTAGKFGPKGRSFVELTVTVRPKGEQQTEVRLNAIFNTKPIEDPAIYQNFFTVVERSLFISNVSN
jgi:hypothetical protein